MKKSVFIFLLLGLGTFLVGCDEDTVDPITLEVNDINLSIDENPENGQVLGTVEGISNREGIIYSLSNQQPAGALTIDSQTGTLTVADASLFDFETNPEITATGTATLENLTRSATITVTLNDVNEERPFITTWKTTSDNESITIPLHPNYEYNFTVNWGDGNEDSYQGSGSNIQASHSYASSGLHTVSISGDFPAIYFINSRHKEFIQTIEQWGTIQWKTMVYAFFRCKELTYNASDRPDLSEVTDLTGMFSQASQFNGAIGNWDVSNIKTFDNMFSNATNFNQNINDWDISSATTMMGMFQDAAFFNQPLNKWNVSQVTEMSNLFYGATAFNQNINDWNVSNVKRMIATFREAQDFNQPLNNWNMSKVTNTGAMFMNATSFNQDINSWDVSKVKDMSNMFQKADGFNQPLNNWNVSAVTIMNDMFTFALDFEQDISSWDVSNVTHMNRMFYQATSFNQDISSWNVSKVKDMNNMFEQASSFNQNLGSWDISSLINDLGAFLGRTNMSIANYNATLEGWANLINVPSNLRMTSTNLKYCNLGNTPRDFLINQKSWVITGDQEASASECD